MKYSVLTHLLLCCFIFNTAFAQNGNWQKIEPRRTTQRGVTKARQDSLNLMKKEIFGREDFDLGAEDNPSPRTGMASWLDDDGNMYIFGGQGYDQDGRFGLFDDFWKFDTKSGEWSRIGGQPGTQFSKKKSSVYPAPRQNTVAWKDKEGGLWLYGGAGLGGIVFFEDLWRYDVKQNAWEWVSGSEEANKAGKWSKKFDEKKSNPLGSRSGSAAWTDDQGNLFVFGGAGVDIESGKEVYFNDLWQFVPGKRIWIQVSEHIQPNEKVNAAGTKAKNQEKQTREDWPSVRKNALTWTMEKSGKLWMYGGFGSDENGHNKGSLSDMWCYDLRKNQWERVSGDFRFNAESSIEKINLEFKGNYPGFRTKSITWVDEKGYFWLVGGQNVISQKRISINSDTWRFNPETRLWRPVISNIKSNVMLGEGTYNPRENVLWFFGNSEYKVGSRSQLPSNTLWKLSIK